MLILLGRRLSRKKLMTLSSLHNKNGMRVRLKIMLSQSRKFFWLLKMVCFNRKLTVLSFMGI